MATDFRLIGLICGIISFIIACISLARVCFLIHRRKQLLQQLRHQTQLPTAAPAVAVIAVEDRLPSKEEAPGSWPASSYTDWKENRFQ
jgi:hypothetical protein